jgi:glycosyltransferase involved in cell wall biosynthesis
MLEERGARLLVVFGAVGYERRKWQYDFNDFHFDYEILHSTPFCLGDEEKVVFLYSGLAPVIKRYNPHIIITNAFSFGSIRVYLRSLIFKIPYIIWSGAIHRKDSEDSFLRKFQRKLLIKRASGFIAYGSKAKEYLVDLGAKEDTVGIGINTVDTSFFERETAFCRVKVIDDNKKHLLYVGHLTKRKRLDLLLLAISELKKMRTDFVLDIVGEGSEKENLIRQCNVLNLLSLVQFEGFKQKTEIPKYLARSACLLFPTGFDIWGLVLVEAMSAGIPCISSIYAGATHDLIEDGVNGFRVDFSNGIDVANKINLILENKEYREYLSKNALMKIQGYFGIKHSAQGILETIEKVQERLVSLNR